MASADFYNVSQPVSALHSQQPLIMDPQIPQAHSTLNQEFVAAPPTPGTPGHLSTHQSNEKDTRYSNAPLLHQDEDGQIGESAKRDIKLIEKDGKLKYRIRYLKIVARFCAFLLAIVVLGTTIYNLVDYYKTRNLVKNGRAAWPKNSKTGPTWLLLAAAITGFLLNLVVLASYLRSHKAANKASTIVMFVSMGFFIAQAFIWAASVGLLKGDSKADRRDIFGWSCRAKDSTLGALYKDEVHFSFSCGSTKASIGIAIAQVVLEVFALVVLLFAFKRRNVKTKRMTRGI